MDTSDPIALEAIKLLRYAVWPATLVFLLLVFHAPISRLIDRLYDIQVERSDKGFKLALAASALTAAEAKRNPNKEIAPTEIVTTVDRALRKVEEISKSPTVLWVDDTPSNNENERSALAPLGFQFTLAKSTAEAKVLLGKQTFDVIVSDFRRPSDPEAGYGLLNHLMVNGPRVPYIIYSGSATDVQVAAAKEHGAFGQTNQPSELFALVLAALRSSGAVTQPPGSADAPKAVRR